MASSFIAPKELFGPSSSKTPDFSAKRVYKEGPGFTIKSDLIFNTWAEMTILRGTKAIWWLGLLEFEEPLQALLEVMAICHIVSPFWANSQILT